MKNLFYFTLCVLIFAAACTEVSYANAIAGNSSTGLYTQDILDNSSTMQLVSSDPSEDSATNSQPSEVAQMLNDFIVDEDETPEQLVACTEGSITGSNQVFMQRVNHEPIVEDEYYDYSTPRNNSRGTPTMLVSNPNGNSNRNQGGNPDIDGDVNINEAPDGSDPDGNGDGGFTSTPEPGTLILMGFGIAGLAAYRRKKANM